MSEPKPADPKKPSTITWLVDLLIDKPGLNGSQLTKMRPDYIAASTIPSALLQLSRQGVLERRAATSKDGRPTFRYQVLPDGLSKLRPTSPAAFRGRGVRRTYSKPHPGRGGTPHPLPEEVKEDIRPAAVEPSPSHETAIGGALKKAIVERVKADDPELVAALAAMAAPEEKPVVGKPDAVPAPTSVVIPDKMLVDPAEEARRHPPRPKITIYVDGAPHRLTFHMAKEIYRQLKELFD